MGDEHVVVAQISVTPVGTKRPDITRYIRECIKIAHLSEMKFQETPLATVVRGPLDEIMKVIKKMHEAPFDLGASRVRTQVILDDYREDELDTPLETTATAQEIAIDQETHPS